MHALNWFWLFLIFSQIKCAPNEMVFTIPKLKLNTSIVPILQLNTSTITNSVESNYIEKDTSSDVDTNEESLETDFTVAEIIIENEPSTENILNNDRIHTEKNDDILQITTSKDFIEKGNKIEKNQRKPVRLTARQNLVLNQIIQVYIIDNVKNNSLCKIHNEEYKIGLKAFEPWALKSNYLIYSNYISAN